MSTDVIIGIGLFPIILVTMRIQKFIEHLKIVIITFYDKHTCNLDLSTLISFS